jgi:hypothetical protein
MSGLTGFNVGYSNTFGGDNSYLDISYIFNPRTSSTNVTNTNMFYKQSGDVYTDISNAFLKSSTNGATGISYEIIAVTKLYDPLSTNYVDIGDLFQPYYNDISFSNITSVVSSGLIIYKYINGVKFINSGSSNYTGRFVIKPGITGSFKINFACVGGGAGTQCAGGGGAGIIIGSNLDMSYNYLYYFGVGNGLKGSGGSTFFRATSTNNDASYSFIAYGGGASSNGDGGKGGNAHVSLSSAFNGTINYISGGGGGGGGYDSSGAVYGHGGTGGTYDISGSPLIVSYGGPGQNGTDCNYINSSNYYGGNGGGNYIALGPYLSFSNIPDQTINYFGGGGGGSSYNSSTSTGYDGFPSIYPTNTWIQGGSGAIGSSGSSSINTTQPGAGGAGARVRSTVSSGGPGYLSLSWNGPLT